ncbi:hypothetical protein B0T17DRAFT_486128 [Bombardia bombarda]|uniref:tRNA-intron lyase n=1 Tax=Bombardia bombarda TaxID=252184 RepID=A0AA39XL71_9PEZI|nr:hypothetical protein B0T17DRAFT_486128 [Bombardia bombarda]
MAETTTVTMPQISEQPSQPGDAHAISNTPVAAGTPAVTGQAAEQAPAPVRVPLNKLYALPVPVRTFPLPSFYPSNPISLFHLVYTWLTQVIFPPAPEPSVIHQGVWDPDTHSVHVEDSKSIRALWEQGFFGKGSLSRSEPNWFKRELSRRGAAQGSKVSEQYTEARREERRLLKWERAKVELEALERQRQEEAQSNGVPPFPQEFAVNGTSEEAPCVVKKPKNVVVEDEEWKIIDQIQSPVKSLVESAIKPPVESALDEVPRVARAPVGPAELLALPNSSAELISEWQLVEHVEPVVESTTDNLSNGHVEESKSPVGPAELLALPNSSADLAPKPVVAKHASVPSSVESDQSTPAASSTQGQANGLEDAKAVNGVLETPALVNGANGHVPSLPSTNGVTEARPIQHKELTPMKRRKSVRFSPRVVSTTFQHFDPPSPSRSIVAASRSTAPVPAPFVPTVPPSAHVGELKDKEHFQLAPEEAFFLSFGLGALTVVDPVTRAPIPTDQLLTLFRAHSYFPPRAVEILRPDDPFLVQYAAYHHFRSLGWVPRHGIKFGVDFILYQRGPVFDHSEFGVMVVPSFSDSLWKDHQHDTAKKSWSWLMGVNRVLAHVLKGLVLVYVDVPSPPVFDELMRQGGIEAALKKYAIREVMVRRFSVNRNR